MTATASKPLAQINERLREAKAARRRAELEVRKIERERERAKAGPRELDPHQQAGPKNVELMREVFKKGKVLTAAAATARAGSPSGHQTWALRALEKEGVIVPTGRRVGVSREYRYVASKGKKTRLGPGE